MVKKELGINVYEAARRRISYTFDHFQKIYLSFSGGKDSTVMLHMVMEEAVKRDRKIGLLFVDLEAQYKITIDHVKRMYELYKDHIDPYWVSLPLKLRNAISVYEPHWLAFDPDKKNEWVRTPPDLSITDIDYFPFFEKGMEFEEFIEKFGYWYGENHQTACFVGIRSDESLNRFRTIANKKASYNNLSWTTYKGESVYNIYPIYDWRTSDIWIYHGKFGKPYNKLYDLMHKAGLTIHQQRICQPYGDDQRKGLWLYHLIEPETWGKVVARVNGANSGALYSQETGNIQGVGKITKPVGMTWEEFAKMLLNSMPEKTREHYDNKIAVFLKWHFDKGYVSIPDEADPKDEANRKVPSWRRICKVLLRNDYWCKGLSFNQTKSESYENYRRVINNKRKVWGLW